MFAPASLPRVMSLQRQTSVMPRGKERGGGMEAGGEAGRESGVGEAGTEEGVQNS